MNKKHCNRASSPKGDTKKPHQARSLPRDVISIIIVSSCSDDMQCYFSVQKRKEKLTVHSGRKISVCIPVRSVEKLGHIKKKKICLYTLYNILPFRTFFSCHSYMLLYTSLLYLYIRNRHLLVKLNLSS